MSWRTVIIRNAAKLSCKNNYLVIRGEQINAIHLSEIGELIIESTQAVVTSYLVEELCAAKIKVVFCDGKHNPVSEIVPYYGAHNTAKRVLLQTRWQEAVKCKLWTRIVRQKIINQATSLQKKSLPQYEKLYGYANDVEAGDRTNREGHAAKVYFNALFTKEFNRSEESNLNAALNYGYAILLSAFNRAIVSKGYITQLGVWHCNEYNDFNLSCDLMEPFRVIVDDVVYEQFHGEFNAGQKEQLVAVLNGRHSYLGTTYYLTNLITEYVQNVLQGLCDGDDSVPLYVYQ